MNSKLETYRKEAEVHGLCDEYAERWNNCKSKKQIISMALSVKAMDYVCDSIAKGWGMDSYSIYKSFNRFINGRFVYDGDGYTSKMYCLFRNNIVADTTAMILIDCMCSIEIPENRICELYIAGETKLSINGKGRCVCVCYGKEIAIDGDCPNIKRIDKDGI